MRLVALILAVAVPVGLACRAGTTAADEPKEKSIDRIVPVVVLKPGETKEVTLSSSCARITRGRGLLLREMGTPYRDAKREWSRGGVSASFVEAKGADDPAPLAKAGLKLFSLRVTASGDAKSQLIELHVADETCSGTCDADIRVVVAAP